MRVARFLLAERSWNPARVYTYLVRAGVRPYLAFLAVQGARILDQEFSED